MNRLAVLLATALPLSAAAQAESPTAPPEAPAAATSSGAPASQRTALALAPRKSGGLTVDLGGWLLWNGFGTLGGLSANDLPRAAVPPSTEQTFGMSARQSRLDVALGLPADGLLGAALLEGYVELDFMGGYVSGDPALPLVRFRQGWISARWPALANLTVLAGQAWGLTGAPEAPLSLGHVAEPRFSGAGFIYRRAPQLRASAELGGALAVKAEAALLAPIDRATSPAPTPAAPDRPPPTSVGERSGLPDVEGRLSVRWRPSERRGLEVGLSGHVGREKWTLTSGSGDVDATLDSYGGALDLRADYDWLGLRGGAFYGKNLDVLNTLSAGVTLSLDAAGRPVAATGVEVWGGWGQAAVRPLAWLTLVLGGGLEAANRSDLPPNPPSATVPLQNLQASGGALVDLTSRLQAGLEYTTYRTTYLDVVDRQVTSGQVQLSTRYVF